MYELLDLPTHADDEFLILAKHRGEVVGRLLWRHVSDQEAHLLNIHVSSNMHRRGVATAMGEHFIGKGHKYHSFTQMSRDGVKAWKGFKESHSHITRDPRWLDS